MTGSRTFLGWILLVIWAAAIGAVLWLASEQTWIKYIRHKGSDREDHKPNWFVGAFLLVTASVMLVLLLQPALTHGRVYGGVRRMAVESLDLDA